MWEIKIKHEGLHAYRAFEAQLSRRLRPRLVCNMRLGMYGGSDFRKLPLLVTNA
jgi:hypothetical protein